MKINTSLKPLAAAILLGATVVPQLHAQEGEEGFLLMLEEVVVTATRREQSLQDVPVAVTAFNAESMERKGFDSFQDLQHSVPNLAMTVVTPFASWVNMRGIPSNPNGVFNSGTSAGMGTYVDGVVYSRPTGFNQDLANTERVEVLRGPQGTLFGQNTNLGVINITTRKPSNDFEGKVKIDVGNYGKKNTTAYVSGPLIQDTLAASFSVFNADRDGYSKNITNGDTTDTEDRTSARAQFRFTPNEQLTADLNFEYLKGRSVSSNGDILDIAPNGLVAFGLMFNPQFSVDDIIIDGARTVSQNSELDLNRQDNKGADLTVAYEFENGFTLKSITAQKTYDSLLSDDYDNTGLNLVVTNQQEDNKQFTQEVQLLSPADDTFSYVAGVFYLDNDAENFQDLKGLEHLYFFAPVGRSVESESDVENKSLAAFVHGTYDFSDELSGFLGLRYSTVEKRVVLEQRSALNYQGGDLFGMVNISDYDETLDDSFLSWTFGLNYDLEPLFSVPSMVYGKVSRGYKEGGFTVRLHTLSAVGGDADNPDIEFEREQATSYELGMKGTLMDQRLRLNAAAFYLDYEDIQTTLLDDDGSFRVENGPAATSKGVELEMTYLLNEYLTFGSNVGYSKANFEDFEACSGTVDCTGNSIPRASDVTGNINLNGRYPINDAWTLFGSIEYSHRSESYLGATNSELTKLDAVNLVNAGVGLESLNTGLVVQAYVKNARDEEYFTSMGDKSSGELAVTNRRYGAPRTYGLRVSYEF